MQLNDSLPIIYSANEELECDNFGVVYIFAYGSKIVLFSFKGTEEVWAIYIGIFRAFCVLCQPMSYLHVS